MYKINIIYDTGDSFSRRDGLEQYLHLTWSDENKAKQALRDIKSHYHYYMILHKEWNADQKDKDKAIKDAKNSKWAVYYKKEKIPSDYSILLENDNSERVTERTFWCGYFEHLVGADIVSEDEDSSFRM